jgi:hypothetical protein
MRIARKLVLLCAMALAAMALGAGNASAQETSVEFVEETGGQCNPCIVTAEGESHIVSTFTGQQVSKCHDVFTSEIWHDGSGHIYDWKGTNHEVVGPGCTVTPCTDPVEKEWDITAPGETGTDKGHMTVRFCLVSGGNTVHCNAEVQVSEPSLHVAQFATTVNCAFGTRRVEGSWTQVPDGGAGFEVNHL